MIWNSVIVTQKWPQNDQKSEKVKNGAFAVSIKDSGDEIAALSDTIFVLKCLIKNVVPCKSQKLGLYVEMTCQNVQGFLHAPFYKYRCDVIMTHVGDIWTIRNVRTDQKTTMYNFEWQKKTLQKLRYDNDCFEPYSPNSHFVTVTVTPKNSHTKNAGNIIINSIKAATHLESRKSDLTEVIYDK